MALRVVELSDHPINNLPGVTPGVRNINRLLWIATVSSQAILSVASSVPVAHFFLEVVPTFANEDSNPKRRWSVSNPLDISGGRVREQGHIIVERKG